MSGPAVSLAGGLVAYNERGRIAGAIGSLLGQALPENVSWTGITVVVSGSTDGTEQVVRDLAEADPRIQLVVQPTREGKSAALAEAFRCARGDYLVLLNGDARAEPGAVKALLAHAAGPDDRFAVMGRPVPPASAPGTFGAAIGLMWSIHHALHAALLAEGTGNHLSDELLLLPIRNLPPLGRGIINDGSFVGGWLSTHAGTLRYASSAVATIVTPASLREHIRQRRRIRYGHAQIRDEFGVTPDTITRYVLRQPRRAWRLVAAECRAPGGLYALATLSLAELLSALLALVDRQSDDRDHVRWRPIAGRAAESLGEPVRAPLSAESG